MEGNAGEGKSYAGVNRSGIVMRFVYDLRRMGTHVYMGLRCFCVYGPWDDGFERFIGSKPGIDFTYFNLKSTACR